MTIATSLPQIEKVNKAAQPTTECRVTCSIDGGIVHRLIVIVYFLALTLPTIVVFIIPDPLAFLVYIAYLFIAILCMIPTSLIYLASIDCRLVICRSQSGRLRVKFTPITIVPVYEISSKV